MVPRKHLHVPTSTRAVCPICKKPVYSMAGIHPQCAMLQSDPRRPVPKGAAAASALLAAAEVVPVIPES